ncbi:GTP pyrophosphokinase [Atopobacter phocae]|uniref:GTP pyrophosphokinase n=1 Tax=Atopobacter phocae TaxID=136492 RepID=UPI0004B85B19|nr:GTP pyrophosphokinase family protein [Atopobacter phocae]
MTDKPQTYSLSMPHHEKQLLEWTRSRGYPYQRLMTYYRCAIKEVETKFQVLDEASSLNNDRNPISGIKTRLKSLPSIVEKLERRGLPLTVESIEENLFDVAGVRVICSFVEDVYKLANSLLAQDDVVLIAKKDYIQSPKLNGYRSLHLIIEIPIFLETEKKKMKVEIQLRTIAMDAWASLEHQLRYKKGTAFTEEMQQALIKCAKTSAQLDGEMDWLREQSNI